MAAALAAAMPTDAVLADLRDICLYIHSEMERGVVTAFVASHLPLTAFQWERVSCYRFDEGRVLLAALDCNDPVGQARHLVQWLRPPDVQRLRTAALCLARVLPPGVPQEIRWSILARALC